MRRAADAQLLTTSSSAALELNAKLELAGALTAIHSTLSRVATCSLRLSITGKSCGINIGPPLFPSFTMTSNCLQPPKPAHLRKQTLPMR